MKLNLSRLIRKRTFSLIGMASIATALVALTPAASAYADTGGSQPNFALDCGALRDVPSQWTVHPNGFCQGWGYSYILTGPSRPHSATWDFNDFTVSGTVSFHVEAWIPNYGAGQHTAYFYQLCGSSSWTYIGVLYQNDDYGWYTPGDITLNQGQVLCAIRETNSGSQTWDMAEDALGLSR